MSTQPKVKLSELTGVIKRIFDSKITDEELKYFDTVSNIAQIMHQKVQKDRIHSIFPHHVVILDSYLSTAGIAALLGSYDLRSEQEIDEYCNALCEAQKKMIKKTIKEVERIKAGL